MKSIHRAALPVFVLAAAVAYLPRVAHADPNNPTDNDKAAARPFAIEGLRLAQAGDCKGAVDKLERGEALVHAPTTAVPLAQCDIQLGHIVAGTEILNRVINETLPPNAPASWAEAKQQAKGILDAASPRIGKLRVHVDLPPGVTPNPEVTIDGQLLPNVLLDNDRPTDPGTHHVTARQQGFGSAETDVTLLDGQSKPVSLQLNGGGAPAAGVVAAPGRPAGGADPYGGQSAAVATAPGAAPTEPAASSSSGAFSNSTGAFPIAIEFGVHFAFGIPFGGLTGANGDDLDHTVSNQFSPLWLNAGVRLAKNWYVGSYFSYGIVSFSNQFTSGGILAANGCQQPGIGCSGNDIRWGIEAAYHFIPESRFDPWLGVGFGYEWLQSTVSASAAATGGAPATINVGLNGWEFVNFQGGLDFRFLDGALGFGPFVQFSLGQYSSDSIPINANGAVNTTGGTMGESVNNQTLHEWFFLGIRGDYDLKIQ